MVVGTDSEDPALIPFTLGTLPVPDHRGRVVRLGESYLLDSGVSWTALYPLWAAVTWAAYFYNGHDALLGDLSGGC